MHLEPHPGSESRAAPYSDGDLERLSRVLIDTSIDARRDHVEVSFADGWATVTGEVFSPRRKCDVERHVRSLAGVKGITSTVAVCGPTMMSLGWPFSGV